MSECIFCSIAAKRAPADIMRETENIVIFADINPKAPIHLLIVPKKHVPSIAHLAPEDRGMVADMVFAAKDSAKEKNLAGYRLCFNVGREGGQIVDHLHLHLLGGWKNVTSEQ